MKVIKKGHHQKGWSITTMCTGNGNDGGGCEAVLLVEQADIYRTESHARDETTAYATFQCPECDVLTNLLDEKIPSHIWDSMIYRSPDTWRGRSKAERSHDE